MPDSSQATAPSVETPQSVSYVAAQDSRYPKRILLIAGVTLLLIIIGVSIPKAGKLNPFQSRSNQKISKRVYTENAVEKVLNPARDKKILGYIKLAKTEKDIDKRYAYYLSAYKLSVKSYAGSHDPVYNKTMNILLPYLKSFPQYSSRDVAISVVAQ